MITASINPDQNELVVDLEDTGRGIHRDHRQRISEPYEKVDIHSMGSGIGLTLASKVATLLHGSVRLMSSTIGIGSHFRATFLEVESACVCQPASSQAQFPRLKNVPSKFYNMTPGLDGISLSDCMARYLINHGLTSSDSIEGCLIIIQLPSDSERCKCFVTIPIRAGRDMSDSNLGSRCLQRARSRQRRLCSRTFHDLDNESGPRRSR
jgi:hypothetical protein